MPNIKSQKKRVKTNEGRRQRNVAVRSRVKTFVGKAQTAIAAKDPNTKEAVIDAISQIDRAVSKGILHRNTAARKKSSLMRLVNLPEAGA
jgi:small subunit ribosomal protein S20